MAITEDTKMIIYRITYKCCHKTSQIELSVFDSDIDDKLLNKFIIDKIEHYKEEDGLNYFPHEIIKSEISIDGETWFASEMFTRPQV